MLSYKKLIENIKDVKIIGIGENTHGSSCFWIVRKKIIKMLKMLEINNNNIIIALEENDDYLKNDINNRFPMHQTKIFEKFQNDMKLLNINIIGVDNYKGNSSNIRNKKMADEIIKLSKEYDKIIFLAFNSHISTFSKPKNFKLDYKGYDSNYETGYYLKKYFNDNYINIGLILLKGKTIGKNVGDYDEKVFDFKNLSDISKLKKGIYKNNFNYNYNYAGMGPFYYDKYNTKWHDFFIIIDYCKKPSL